MSLHQSKDWNPALTGGHHTLNGLYAPVNLGPKEGKDPRGGKGSPHWRSGNEYPHFGKKSEVQRGMATCLRAHSTHPEADLGCLLSELKRIGRTGVVGGGGRVLQSGAHMREAQQGLLPTLLPGSEFSSGAPDQALGVTTGTPGGGSPGPAAPPCSGQRQICGIQRMHPEMRGLKARGAF